MTTHQHQQDIVGFAVSVGTGPPTSGPITVSLKIALQML